ncbi:hypothetical protein OFY17_09105 [Marinomonas sp. C2222]|uniref:DUF4870 domain-containing protein n=1 Tax=Marinomonas sargassi TaxID=2984494 RepID=A0ABT2YT17_9GAMM|nr:hypothetical protein [Marinomonas sargassi]MCV2403033.1 hypothetical protein [Marinomonas sargassi]
MEPQKDFDANSDNKRPFQGLSAQDDAAKKNVLISYILMLVGVFTGVFWFIGAVWAMVKQSEAKGTLFEDHYKNIISTFWWGIAVTLLGLFLTFFFVGVIILFAIWVWSIFKMVKGLSRVLSNQPFSSVNE